MAKVGTKSRWPFAEDRQLIQLASHGVAQAIADELDRTHKTIISRTARLGVSLEPSAGLKKEMRTGPQKADRGRQSRTSNFWPDRCKNGSQFRSRGNCSGRVGDIHPQGKLKRRVDQVRKFFRMRIYLNREIAAFPGDDSGHLPQAERQRLCPEYFWINKPNYPPAKAGGLAVSRPAK